MLMSCHQNAEQNFNIKMANYQFLHFMQWFTLFSSADWKDIMFCVIWGTNYGDYEDNCNLGYNSV
jgi:hypothetical protein